jgi:hypothetical protein
MPPQELPLRPCRDVIGRVRRFARTLSGHAADTEGPEKGNTSLGIYELQGDDLKLCLTITAKDRPTEFAAKPKSGHGFEVLKREKPKKE